MQVGKFFGGFFLFSILISCDYVDNRDVPKDSNQLYLRSIFESLTSRLNMPRERNEPKIDQYNFVVMDPDKVSLGISLWRNESEDERNYYFINVSVQDHTETLRSEIGGVHERIEVFKNYSASLTKTELDAAFNMLIESGLFQQKLANSNSPSCLLGVHYFVEAQINGQRYFFGDHECNDEAMEINPAVVEFFEFAELHIPSATEYLTTAKNSLEQEF